MSLTVTPEIEAQLQALAHQTGRDPQEIADKALRQYIEREAEIISRIRVGMEQADQGKVVPHAQVMANLEAILAARTARPQ